MASDITLTAAAAAGLLSFLSPCVLPLVPPYLTFIAGTTVEELPGHVEVVPTDGAALRSHLERSLGLLRVPA